MTDAPPNRTRHRLLRFSLRTLLLVMWVLGVALAWLALKLERARKQQEAVAWVRQIGGMAWYGS